MTQFFWTSEKEGLFLPPQLHVPFFNHLDVKTSLQLRTCPVNRTSLSRGPRQLLWHHRVAHRAWQPVCVRPSSWDKSCERQHSYTMTTLRKGCPRLCSWKYYLCKPNVRNTNVDHFSTFQKVLCAPWSIVYDIISKCWINISYYIYLMIFIASWYSIDHTISSKYCFSYTLQY